jgi:hypothetical protein
VRRLAVLSVHYLRPELLRDQIDRLRLCAGPVYAGLGARLVLFPILHRWAHGEAVTAVLAAARRDPGLVEAVDLRDRPAEVIPRDDCHGHSLAEAYQALRATARLEGDDLVALLDHDAHPLHTEAFLRLARPLLGPSAPAGIGVPQWHRGHCFLHPSFLVTRAALVDAMGAEQAFKLHQPARNGRAWSDTGEGFTIWCEQNGRPILPLRVIATEFPWSRWDSDMVPGRGTELTGWHGEPVRVGYLMRYGLDADTPLLSHVWSVPLEIEPSMRFGHQSVDEVMTAYSKEPLQGA